MNVQFLNDTIYAVWGDVRTGNLSIYLNKIAVASGTSSISTITKEELTPTAVYPNPANEHIRLLHYFKSDRYVIYDRTGRPVLKGRKFPEEGADIRKLAPGSYTLILENGEWQLTTSFIKE
jgi:hypothetical protein